MAERLSSSRSKPGGSVGVRVLRATTVVAAILAGSGALHAAQTASSAWFYTNSSDSIENGSDKTLSSAELLSRFAQADEPTTPVAFVGSSPLGGRDFEVASPLGRNLAVEFGSHIGSRFGLGALDGESLFTNQGTLMLPLSATGREAHVQSAVG